jgi:hypothetical protein
MTSADATSINWAAPATASAELLIEAPSEVVWSTLVDIESWPAWNPDVESAEVHGALAEGVAFSWKAGGMSIESRLEDVSSPSRLAWTGTTLGTRAIHVSRFISVGDQTRAVTEESFEGPLPWLLRVPMRKVLAASLSRGLVALKAESERRGRD